MVYDVAPATAPQLIDTWLLPAITVTPVGAPGRATGGGGGGVLPLAAPPPPHAAANAAVIATMHREIPLRRRWPAYERAKRVAPAVAASVRNKSAKEPPPDR